MSSLTEKLEALEALAAKFNQAGGNTDESEEDISAGRRELSSGLFQGILGWPGTAFLEADEDVQKRVFNLLVDVCDIFGDEQMKDMALFLGVDPADTKWLYQLGYQLIEQTMPRAAATILKKALNITAVPKYVPFFRSLFVGN
jgi:hypothetical protein